MALPICRRLRPPPLLASPLRFAKPHLFPPPLSLSTATPAQLAPPASITCKQALAESAQVEPMVCEVGGLCEVERYVPPSPG